MSPSIILRTDFSRVWHMAQATDWFGILNVTDITGSVFLVVSTAARQRLAHRTFFRPPVLIDSVFAHALSFVTPSPFVE